MGIPGENLIEIHAVPDPDPEPEPMWDMPLCLMSDTLQEYMRENYGRTS